MQQLKSYHKANEKRYLEELLELLRVPSVSADPAYKEEVAKTAKMVQTALKKAGATVAEIHPTKGHPIVYAEKIIDNKLPTILIYGHYDVQPADPLELWDSPPFEPVIKKVLFMPEVLVMTRDRCICM